MKVAKPREGGPAGNVRVGMKRGAAITGRVVDNRGVPVLAATVVVHAASSATSADTPPRLLSALTDDLGEFRFGGLPEGEFQVGSSAGVIDPRAAQTASTSANGSGPTRKVIRAV